MGEKQLLGREALAETKKQRFDREALEDKKTFFG
jgi:hypothetical protein